MNLFYIGKKILFCQAEESSSERSSYKHSKKQLAFCDESCVDGAKGSFSALWEDLPNLRFGLYESIIIRNTVLPIYNPKHYLHQNGRHTVALPTIR